jgi:hypothetical protein
MGRPVEFAVGSGVADVDTIRRGAAGHPVDDDRESRAGERVAAREAFVAQHAFGGDPR